MNTKQFLKTSCLAFVLSLALSLALKVVWILFHFHGNEAYFYLGGGLYVAFYALIVAESGRKS